MGEGFDRGGAFGEFQWLAENLTFEADVVPVHGDRSAACLPVDIAFGVDGGDDGVAFKGFVCIKSFFLPEVPVVYVPERPAGQLVALIKAVR